MTRSALNMALLAAAISAGGVLLGATAQASVITPGTSGAAPDVFSSSISGSVLATDSSSFSQSNNGQTVSGTYTTEVVADSGRGGLLDFIIQVTNGASPSQVLEHVTNGVFTGFTTDVGYLSTGKSAGTLTSPAGGVAPSTVDSSINAVIGFDFSTGIANGATTDVLVIETNAVNYQPGSIGIIDSVTATVPGFEPANVPEPASLLLLGSGLIGLGAFARRRRKQA